MHTIQLQENSNPYCVLLLYFASASYASQIMLIGLSTSPAIWQSHIHAILSTIPDRSKYLAIVENLFLQVEKHVHLKYLEDLMKVLLKSGLKI